MKTLMFLFQTTVSSGGVDWIKTVFVVMGWILSVFLGLLCVAFIKKFFDPKFDLIFLICDAEGKPSMARFQNLIFTVVIAMGLFYLIGIKSEFPAIHNGIWVLLGISAGTFAVTKTLEETKSTRMIELNLRKKELELREKELEQRAGS
ncbi:MAG TPA: hypothetical protein VGB00_20245 [Pyrinomonadaceae bacterium]|jgi:hypothetical protein